MPIEYRKTGQPCPICHDTTVVCEHICQACDKIVGIGTCTNGKCEECCAEQCDLDFLNPEAPDEPEPPG